jgi:hypothetical protein
VTRPDHERRIPPPPPVAGDLIIVTLPEGEPVPAGWTEVRANDGARACYRTATGHETSFPFPSAGFDPATVRPDGMADQRGMSAP